MLRVWAQFDLCFMIFVVANGALIGIQAGKTGNDFSWPWSTETKKVDRVLIQVAKWSVKAQFSVFWRNVKATLP